MSLPISSLTEAHLEAGILWIAKMSARDKWNLTDEDVANLLGGIDTAAYQNMKRKAAEGKPLTMTQETVERLSLLLGIWKALQLMIPANRQDLAVSWFNKSNRSSMFANKSIKEFMLEKKTIDAMYEVKEYLDCENWETSFGDSGVSSDFM